MEKTKLTAVLAISLALLFAGCNAETGTSAALQEGLASVNLTIETAQEKSLNAETQNAGITDYRFKALSSSQEAKGESDDYETFGSENSNSCEISSRFSPGYWTFEVQARNTNGVVLYQGTKNVYLGSGSNNVTVTVSPVINTGENLQGSLEIDITAPKIKASSDGVFKAYCTSLTAANAQSVEVTGISKKSGFNTEGYCSGYKSSHALSPGFYILSVQYYEDSQATVPCSTAVVPFRIIEGSATRVYGVLEGFLFSSVTLSVETQNLTASMSALANTFAVTAQAAGYTNVTYRWFINGTNVGETGSSLLLTSWFGDGEDKVPKSPGYYLITCVIMGRNSGGTYEAVCCRGHVLVNGSGNFVAAAVE